MPKKSDGSRLVSPNDLLDAAKTMMLDGRKPRTHEDWERVMHFLAVNVQRDVSLAACTLFAKIYDMPLTDAEVRAIVAFQLAHPPVQQ